MTKKQNPLETKPAMYGNLINKHNVHYDSMLENLLMYLYCDFLLYLLIASTTYTKHT